MNICQNNKVLEIINISKSYDTKIINDINLFLFENEIVCILGESGVGKSTLFNIISGVDTPDTGQIILNKKDITRETGHISYMLQKDLLIEQKNIMANVILPLRIKGMKKSSAIYEAEKYFDEFGINGTQNMYPSQLSGGMRQRAAFLRTYLNSQKVVLLDEPFSALDYLTKNEMHNWYLSTCKKLELSTIFITHDIDEAIKLSDRIYIMSGKPGMITNEIKIKRNTTKEEFIFTEEFLHYKKIILSKLR